MVRNANGKKAKLLCNIPLWQTSPATRIFGNTTARSEQIKFHSKLKNKYNATLGKISPQLMLLVDWQDTITQLGFSRYESTLKKIQAMSFYVGITAFYRREPSAKDHLHEQIISTDLQWNYPISKFMLKLLNVGVIYMKIISLKGVEVVKVSIFLITYVSEVV